MKGEKRTANDGYSKIQTWLNKQTPNTKFFAHEVAAATGVDTGVVSTFLTRRVTGGFLLQEKTPNDRNTNTYTVTEKTKDAREQIPKGKLADVVFEELKKHFEPIRNTLEFKKTYLRENHLTERIRGVFRDVSEDSVHNVIQRWHRDGHLEKNPDGFGYRPTIAFLQLTERPLALAKKKQV